MRKICLILNGKAASHDSLRRAVGCLRNEGATIEVHVTWEAGDAFRFAAAAADEPNQVVVAGGGDGTVNEVANGLMSVGSPQAILGVLPYGTANDFATGAGIPLNDPYAAIHLAATTDPVAIDLGCMNGRYFVNVASGGFGAEVTARTPLQLKNLLGGGAYGLTALVMAMHARPYRGTVSIDGGPATHGSMVMMAVGNARLAGGGAHMTPFATIDDGLLDVMIVPSHDSERFAHLLADLIELKEHGGEHYRYIRARTLALESEDTLQFNLDGEPVCGKSFEFSIAPSALNFAAPRGSPLLKN